ncbi:MAG: glutamine--tRNA ligase/YqeY domain fusion protein [Polyangiaceae bacterium]|nr:glutamine--tRNA ligase/YqeY domain fusion protein [Polyangiaceae bacterium]
MIRTDVAAGKHGGHVVTRFPPEPNGFLHIGHAKAICIDFGVAREFGGCCHLRMDDTNPTTEDVSYVEAIRRDIEWLGFDCREHMYYASDYFERYYELGQKLIRLGRAYVCDLSDEEFSKSYRGTIGEPGKESPYRKRSVAENLDLFERMRKGEFKDGEKVLRARIDMSSPNMKMRDPPLVRIKHAHHYRAGDAWCIYPLYDFAHCLEDSFEGVTHSLCTMEFESARELYDWVLRATEVPHVPKQTEFARLNLTHTLLSKRRLKALVDGKYVRGWDDPRMPTIAGLRRRGYTPEAIREFCMRIGVSRNLSTVEMEMLEHIAREDLDARSPRAMAILRPLRVVIESLPERAEMLTAPYWPPGTAHAPGVRDGTRELPLTREIYIEREDFAEDPPKGWKRLAPGREVRLFYGYVITCTKVVKNDAGEIVELRVTHDPSTRGGVPTPGKRVEGTIQWVSATHGKKAEVRLYDRLFSAETPGEDGRDWLADLNPRSLEIVRAIVEPALADAAPGDRYQFTRLGYFYADDDSAPGAPVYNRTVALKDGWAKVVAKESGPSSKREPALESGPPSKRAAASVLPRDGAPPELSVDARALVVTHGLSENEARVLSQEPVLRAIYDEVLRDFPASQKLVASLLANDVLGELHARKLDALPFGASACVELVSLVLDGSISTKQEKDVLAEMIDGKERSPRAIVAARGMKQIANADALGPIVDEVLMANADAVARFKGGNANVMGALVGLVMKASKGQANPKLVSDLLKKKLG